MRGPGCLLGGREAARVVPGERSKAAMQSAIMLATHLQLFAPHAVHQEDGQQVACRQEALSEQHSMLLLSSCFQRMTAAQLNCAHGAVHAGVAVLAAK